MSLFTNVHFSVPKSHVFRRSRENHVSTQFGKLTPILVEEVYPGDSFKIGTEASIKLAPMRGPAMARIDCYFHYFFVPNRLLYDRWEDFITGGTQGNIQSVKSFTDSSNPSDLEAVLPNFDFADLFTNQRLKIGNLTDFFGLPSLNSITQTGSNPTGVPPINALPFAAYCKIYSDWYRDELLDTYEFVPLSDGNIPANAGRITELISPRYRCWHKDYFTSARPDTQLGEPTEVPLSGSLVGDGPLNLSFGGSSDPAQRYLGITSLTQDPEDSSKYYGPLSAKATATATTGYAAQYYEGISLEDAGFLINDLRRSLKLQEWKEKNMRGGNRYIENIFNHFGVRSSDARLQRSQYLGGKKMPVVVGEVLQSVGVSGDAEYSAGDALGTRGGVAAAGGSTQRIKFTSEEHGWIIGIMSILPHASYFQGIPRYMADRWDRYSYLWPEFSNLGEQEVYNWEIYAGWGSNDGVFGYQSRFADLKTGFSEVHGEFRTNLNFWHTARIFQNRPSLNNSFVNFGNSDNANGMNRIFAVTSNASADHFWCHLYNHVRVIRKASKYGTPGI